MRWSSTEWNVFRSPDFDLTVKARLKSPVVFDGRNLYDLERMKRAGFAHYGIGGERFALSFDREFSIRMSSQVSGLI